MKILVNTSTTNKGGGIQVAKSFIEECKVHVQNEYFVVLSPKLSKNLDIDKFPSNFSFFIAPFRPATRFFTLKSHNKFLKQIEARWKPDVVFTTSGPSYWKPLAPHLMGYNIPHYVYPESNYFNIITFKSKIRWYLMKVFAKYIFKRDADAFVVQTDDINDRLKKLLNRTNVYTVFNTVNSHYNNPKKNPNKLPKRNENEFRLLSLSAWYPHKNLRIIPNVLDFLEEKGYNNIKFVVTLPDEDFLKLSKITSSSNLINVGVVKVEEGPSLYNECDAMFLPTLLECFSASYVEAMKMEKPIVTSDMGFARTICDTAAIYFDSVDPKDAADKIIQLYNSISLQSSLKNRGLKRVNVFGTPEERAKKYLKLCKKLLNNSVK